MKKLWRIALLAAALAVAPAASAHQPVYRGLESWTEVRSPEVSKAYYGFLSEKPAIYVISSDRPFALYVNILSPEKPDGLIAEVYYQDGRLLRKLGGEGSAWTRWYEPFAGDWYWRGPEWKTEAASGTYTVVVSKPGNLGKYALAIGEKESFPLSGLPGTLKNIYLAKTEFFEKAPWAILGGTIGLGLSIGAAALILLAWAASRIVRKR